MKTFRRIFYATDLSSASKRAFNMALKIAKQNKSGLLLFHALNISPYIFSGQPGDAALYARVEADARKQAQSTLSRLGTAAKKRGVKCRLLIGEGSPADRIVRSAKSNKCDLIVVGTRGRTGVSKVFLGSVAARVAATAACPVLIVRER